MFVDVGGLYIRIYTCRNGRNWKNSHHFEHRSVNGKDPDVTNMNSSSYLPVSSRSEGEILQSSNLKSFSYNELRAATRNFHPGEGGFGFVYKGWIDEHSLAATKPGTGIVVAVKKLNQEGFQGHREWLAEINYLGKLQHPKVIYGDIKTFNILLDSNYNAKLADFGLARDGPTGDKSHVSTRVMGTHGYAAPEYLETGITNSGVCQIAF